MHKLDNIWNYYKRKIAYLIIIAHLHCAQFLEDEMVFTFISRGTNGLSFLWGCDLNYSSFLKATILSIAPQEMYAFYSEIPLTCLNQEETWAPQCLEIQHPVEGLHRTHTHINPHHIIIYFLKDYYCCCSNKFACTLPTFTHSSSFSIWLMLGQANLIFSVSK